MPITRRSFARNAVTAFTAVSLGPLTSKKSSPVKMKVVCVGGHPDDPETGCGGTLAKLAAAIPEAKIQLLHFPNSPQAEGFAEFIKQSNTYVEISRFEGNGAIGRMIGTAEGLPSLHVPVERILFGSHAPYFPVETALLKLIESPLGVSQLRVITNENARRLMAA